MIFTRHLKGDFPTFSRWFTFFFFQPSLVGIQLSSSMSTGCVVPLRFEPFSATLAQDGLEERDQPGKNPLKYSTMAGN